MSERGSERGIVGSALVKAAMLTLVVFGAAPQLFRPPSDWVAYGGVALIAFLVLFVALAWEEHHEGPDEHILFYRWR